MPAVVPLETAPQMFRALVVKYDGTEKAALAFKDKRTKEWTDITYGTLNSDVQALAAFLHSKGVRKGDRVALLSENRPEWAVTDLATQMLGAVTVALYTTLPAGQVAYIIRDSGAKVLIVSTGLQLRKAVSAFDSCPDLELVVSMAAPRKTRKEAPVITWEDALAEGSTWRESVQAELDATAEGVTPDDLSALIYTSGTTGEPKGVMMTQRNLMSNTQAVHDHIDVHLSFLPLSHAFERTAGYTTVLSAGAKIVYAESIDTVSRNLVEVSPTLMVSVPRLFEKVYNTILKTVQSGSFLKRGLFAWAVDTGSAVALMHRLGKKPGPILSAQKALADKLVFSSLHEKLGGRIRFAVSGGAALPKAIGQFFEAAGVTLVEGYGLSETAPILAANPLEAPVFGTVGRVMPSVTLAIRDVRSGDLIGELCGDDYPSTLSTGPGEILAKGPNVMPGYWNRPEDTAEVFDHDGWFKSGDIGRFENGYLRITDRIKHMIVSKGGKNIYPGPIEEKFSVHPLIEQVMVVGEGREFLTALVVPDFDALREEAKTMDVSVDSDEDLASTTTLIDLYADLFRADAKEAASHEKIRDVRLITEPFSVENELLTPTLKYKRSAIERRYAAEIESMYSGVV